MNLRHIALLFGHRELWGLVDHRILTLPQRGAVLVQH